MDAFLWDILGFVLVVSAVASVLWFYGILVFRPVRSGTAVAFELFDDFIYCVMSSEDLHFTKDGFIEEGPGWQSYAVMGKLRFARGWLCIWRIGNLVIYLSPFIKTAKYCDHNDDDGFGKEDVILLHDLQIEFTNLTAETKPTSAGGATIPATPKWFYRMMVANPQLFLYRTTKHVVADVSKAMEGITRLLVTKCTVKQLQSLQGHSATGNVWTKIYPRASSIDDILKDRWGVRIMPNSVELDDVGFDPKFQESLQNKAIAKLDAEADTEGLTTFQDGLIASELGFGGNADGIKKLKQKIEADPAFVDTPKYKEALIYAKDMAKRKHAAEHGELTDMRIGSTDGTPFKGNVLFTGGGGGKKGH